MPLQRCNQWHNDRMIKSFIPSHLKIFLKKSPCVSLKNSFTKILYKIQLSYLHTYPRWAGWKHQRRTTKEEESQYLCNAIQSKSKHVLRVIALIHLRPNSRNSKSATMTNVADYLTVTTSKQIACPVNNSSKKRALTNEILWIRYEIGSVEICNMSSG